MIKKLQQNQWVRDETASWWSSLANAFSLQNLQTILFYLIVFLLPTQLGKHFWPFWSYVYGQRIDYLSPTLYVTDVLTGLLCGVTLLKKEIRLNLFFALSIVCLSFSIFFSQNPLAGWYTLLKLLEMSFFTYFVWTHAQKYKKSTLGFFLGVSMLLESVIAFFQFFLQRSIGGLLYFLGERTFSGDTPGIANASIHGSLVLRPYGTFPHPNVLAGFLLIGMLLYWYFLQADVIPWKKYLLLFVVGLGSFGLLITLSRATILLGICLATFLILQKFRKRFIPLFLGGSILLLLLFPTVFFRFAPSTFEESVLAREQLFSAGLIMFFSHPLFGVGLGNFLSSLPTSMLLQPVHNIFLLWTEETGIVGGALMVLCFFFLLRRGVKQWRIWTNKEKENFSPLLLAFLSIIVLGMFDHYFLTLQQGQLLFSFVSGLLLASLTK